MEALHGAPVIVLVLTKADKHRTITGVTNIVCMNENMSLATTDLGIGSVFIMGAIRALSQDKELRAGQVLPEGFTPIGAVDLGHSKEPLDYVEKTEKRISVNTVKC